MSKKTKKSPYTSRVIAKKLKGKRLHLYGIFDGELARPMGPKYGRWRVYIPDATRDFRDTIATAMHKAARKVTKKIPTRLVQVIFDVWSTKTRPDMDTAYHQVQDALTKDMWGLDDRYVTAGRYHRTLPPAGAGPMFFIEALYEL